MPNDPVSIQWNQKEKVWIIYLDQKEIARVAHHGNYHIAEAAAESVRNNLTDTHS